MSEPLRLATYAPALSRDGPSLLLREIRGGEAQVTAAARVIADTAPTYCCSPASTATPKARRLPPLRHCCARRVGRIIPISSPRPRMRGGVPGSTSTAMAAATGRAMPMAMAASPVTALWRCFRAFRSPPRATSLGCSGATCPVRCNPRWMARPFPRPRRRPRYDCRAPGTGWCWPRRRRVRSTSWPSPPRRRSSTGLKISTGCEIATRSVYGYGFSTAVSAPAGATLRDHRPRQSRSGRWRGPPRDNALADTRLLDPLPRSLGGHANATPGQAGDPELDTADWDDAPEGPGNLRVGYVLPSRAGLRVTGAGVVWPAADLLAEAAAEASAHRLVWVDLELE